MALNFYSKQLAKEISLDKLTEVKGAELIILKDELEYAIGSMDKSLIEIKAQKERDNEPYDQEWHQRVRRKQKVCEAFLLEIAKQDDLYEIIYKNCFTELLSQIITQEEFTKLESDAKIEAEFKILEMKNKS
tara:strand:+ start:394 stop:789 length:396 start_codon:yes stop_codon:yes gene_type:complete